MVQLFQQSIIGREAPIINGADGSFGAPWFTREGARVAKQWLQAMIEAGYGFIFDFGPGDAPETEQTAYALRQPSMNVDVPAGLTVVPVYFDATPRASGAAGFLAHLMTCNLLLGAGTSTVITPANAAIGALTTPRAIYRKLYTANGADLALATQTAWLFDALVNQDLDATSIFPRFTWKNGALGGEGAPCGPVTGPASINAYIANPTSGTASGKLVIVELPSGLWTPN